MYKIKVLQLNAWNFRYFDAMVALIEQEKPDIIHLQEVSDGLQTSKNFWKCFKEKIGYHAIFHPAWEVKKDGATYHMGIAILTKSPMQDYGCFFDRFTQDFRTYDFHEDQLFQTKDRKMFYVSAFQKPIVFSWCTLNLGGILVRTITSHFTISYECTETLQIIRQAEQLRDFILRSKDIPTIFSADMNIGENSAAYSIISQALTPITTKIKNTLNPAIHPAFDPENAHNHNKTKKIDGLKVDHIFQKGFKINKVWCPEVTVSDHLPVFATLELQEDYI